VLQELDKSAEVATLVVVHCEVAAIGTVQVAAVADSLDIISRYAGSMVSWAAPITRAGVSICANRPVHSQPASFASALIPVHSDPAWTHRWRD